MEKQLGGEFWQKGKKCGEEKLVREKNAGRKSNGRGGDEGCCKRGTGKARSDRSVSSFSHLFFMEMGAWEIEDRKLKLCGRKQRF